MEFRLYTICLLCCLYGVTFSLPIPNEETPTNSKDEHSLEVSNSDSGKELKNLQKNVDLTIELKNRKEMLEHLLRDTNQKLDSLEKEADTPDGDDEHLQRDSRFIAGQPIIPSRRIRKKGKRLMSLSEGVPSRMAMLEKIIAKLQEAEGKEFRKITTTTPRPVIDPQLSYIDSLLKNYLNCHSLYGCGETARETTTHRPDELQVLSEQLGQNSKKKVSYDRLSSQLSDDMTKIQNLLSKINSRISGIM